MNIIGIKTKDNYFISQFSADGYKKYSCLDSFWVNKKKPTPSFHEDWSIVEEIPTIVQREVDQPNINHRYELKDSLMVSQKTPLVFKREEVATYSEAEWTWKPEYSMYYSLYKPVSDPQPIIMEDVEFTFHLILEIDEIKDFGKMQFEVPRSPYQSSDAKKFINENNVIHQLIDKIQFPPILLPSKPNALSPQQSFDIVRHYIKQHINLDFAEITSDYDFCFTAAKKIAYTKKEAYTVDVNNSWLFQKRKRKPKYKTRYRSHRTVTCFSMAPKPYQSYSVIDGFRGKDQEDLENNIADYCKQVIDYINEPLVDCPHCEGKGVVFTGALDCNSIKEKL